MAKSKKWSELSTPQRVAAVVAGAIELVLTTVALRDLASADSSTVRGPKWLWALVCLVQPVGPVAYLVVGRSRPAPQD